MARKKAAQWDDDVVEQAEGDSAIHVAESTDAVESTEVANLPSSETEGEPELPAYTEDENGRHVTIDHLGSIVIHLPSLAEQEEGEWEYSRVYMDALRRGIPVRKEIEKMLTDRGIIFNVKRRDDLMKRLRAVILEIQDLGDVQETDTEATEALARLQREGETLQEQLAELQSEEDEYFSHTAEKKADQARIVYLAALCTEWDDPERQGQRVWEAPLDFLKERRATMVTEILAHFMAMALQGAQ